MKTYVWTLPVRLFHWLLAIGFVSAYILGDFEIFDDYRNWHFAFGAFVGVLLLFRIIYGFIGNKYANFKDFPLAIKYQKEFFKNYFSKGEDYVGHNPMAALVMLSIFIVGVFTSFSGYFLHLTSTKQLVIEGITKHNVKEVHEIMANLFLFLVGLHLVGLASDFIFHGKTKTIKSMISGYKNVSGESSKLSKAQKMFSILWIIVPILFFILGFGLKKQNNNQERNFTTEQLEQEESE
jgi:cytochrome b